MMLANVSCDMGLGTRATIDGFRRVRRTRITPFSVEPLHTIWNIRLWNANEVASHLVGRPSRTVVNGTRSNPNLTWRYLWETNEVQLWVFKVSNTTPTKTTDLTEFMGSLLGELGDVVATNPRLFSVLHLSHSTH